MPDDVVTDVLPESSTGTIDAPPTPTAQAPSTPVQPPAEQQIPYARFQQVIRQNQELRTAVQGLQQQMQTFKQQEQRGVPLTAQQEVERREALTAIKELFGADDELKSLLDLAKNAQKITEATNGVSRLTEQNQQASMTRARAHVATLAATEGLPKDPKFLTRLTRLVAMEAQSLPDAERRFDAGDYTVLDDAFAAVKGDFASMRREQTVQTAATKQQLQRTVPPRPAGGASGPEAPPKLEQGKERQFWEGAMSKMRDRLRE